MTRRIVLDTNVVIAALLWHGPPRRLLDRAIEDDGLRLFSSTTLIEELAETLRYPKFEERIRQHGTTIERLIAHYTALVTLVSPTVVPRVVEFDADDDHVIAAAVVARAQLIVTGDRTHLLPLAAHAGIAIVTASDALRLIADV